MALRIMIQSYCMRAGTCLAVILMVGLVYAQTDSAGQTSRTQTSPAQGAQNSSEPVFLSFAKFKIPFNIERKRSELSRVQLWVSTDKGESWQMHGSAQPGDQYFDFSAAAEGTYFFSVQTVDHQGGVYPSQSPPLKIMVDTTKPDAAIRADINASGELTVDIRTYDENLDLDSAELNIRTDRDPTWRKISVDRFDIVNEIYQSQVITQVGMCREVGIVFSIADRAQNTGEASFKLDMPRTAQGRQDMTLASNQAAADIRQVPLTGAPTIQGAIEWRPAEKAPVRSGAVERQPGRLAATESATLPPRYESQAEELPPPAAMREYEVGPNGQYTQASPGFSTPVSSSSPSSEQIGREPQAEDLLGQAGSIDGGQGGSGAYFCKTSAFSLDYAVESLGGSTLSSVELWGTANAGRTWQLWGEDPDRQSPFDVQVEDEGLFGFRMVIVGSNGVVSNRPQDGDSADVWIHIDTTEPTVKITRAVYGKGEEDGMLVIDYNCQDSNLVAKPISLAYSETVDGPWQPIANGQANTGLYLWKASPNLPQRIYLKLEAVDKAGNVGVHRLDLPINTRGLGPRGRIQGFRPIFNPSQQ